MPHEELRCGFRIAGDDWLVEGLPAASLGPWVRDVGARVPDVRVHARCESSSTRKAGVSGSPGEPYRLTAEDFACEVSASLDDIEVLGEPSALADGVRTGVRLGAMLRCLAGGGLALHASCVATGNGHDARAFVLAGPSGAGKTTAASHAVAAGARKKADDLVLLRRDEATSQWRASGLPWEAGVDLNEGGEPVRAAALVRIAPALEYSLARVTGARAAALALACPPESLGVETERIIISTTQMVAELPVFRAELPEGPDAIERMLDEVREAAAE
jgi:hypothetical protein